MLRRLLPVSTPDASFAVIENEEEITKAVAKASSTQGLAQWTTRFSSSPEIAPNLFPPV